MRLVVRIPEQSCQTYPDAACVARLAPNARLEGEGDQRALVATFDRLPEDLDLAVRLIAEVVPVPDVWISINARRVVSPTRFWSALICYRDSLDEPDARTYCAQKSAQCSDAAGCPNRTCLSPCQFICTRCLSIVHERGSPPLAAQLEAIAVQAEVEWCPNLTVARDETPL
ncbi:hypothetical protein [Candidatus Nitrospira bockiana]